MKHCFQLLKEGRPCLKKWRYSFDENPFQKWSACLTSQIWSTWISRWHSQIQQQVNKFDCTLLNLHCCPWAWGANHEPLTCKTTAKVQDLGIMVSILNIRIQVISSQRKGKRGQHFSTTYGFLDLRQQELCGFHMQCNSVSCLWTKPNLSWWFQLASIRILCTWLHSALSSWLPRFLAGIWQLINKQHLQEKYIIKLEYITAFDMLRTYQKVNKRGKSELELTILR
jgi:hypothetical protein